MEEAGIISKANSPRRFNLVVVSHFDDAGTPTTPRITTDYRKLNAVTYNDRFPLPNIKNCLQTSSVDMSNSNYPLFLMPFEGKRQRQNSLYHNEGSVPTKLSWAPIAPASSVDKCF